MSEDHEDRLEGDQPPPTDHPSEPSGSSTGPSVPVVVDPACPPDTAYLVSPGPRKSSGAIVGLVSPKDLSTTTLRAQDYLTKPKEEWVCTECGTVWTTDPGRAHTHEVAVPGSLSRVTYENYEIEKRGAR